MTLVCYLPLSFLYPEKVNLLLANFTELNAAFLQKIFARLAHN